jgi:type IV secretion system protein VirB9
MNALILASLLASTTPAIAQLPPGTPGAKIGYRTDALAVPAPDAKPTFVRSRARRATPTSPGLRAVRASNRVGTIEPNAASSINAVQVYPFNEGAIYHVLTAPGRVTDIVLQPGETLGAVAAGDTVRWVIGDTVSGSGDTKRTHVLVKPFTAGLATNIIVTTDRHTYHLLLTSADRFAMVAISWIYPQDALIAFKAAQEHAEAAQPVASGLQIEQLHFNYLVTGDQPAWRPLRAFDDGRQTYVEFPATLGVGEAPPLFLVDAKGNASLVNYRVKGRFYIVDRLFDVAELRLGLKHQDVVRITRVADGDQRRTS